MKKLLLVVISILLSLSSSFAGKLEKKKLTIGFIALTDCAPLVIAKEKGFLRNMDWMFILLKRVAAGPVFSKR